MSHANAAGLPGLPLQGGEPVFAEPWQAQAFALALQLHERGAFSWAEWTETLTEQLTLAGPGDDGSRYYEHWLAALETLVSAKALIAPAVLAERKQAWAAAYRRTPHGQPVELGAATAMPAYKAVWTGLGAPLHHEAATVEDIIAWGDAMWGANMGDVWITAPGQPPMSLADFKKQLAGRP